jgi:2-oxoglutarate ferredoxin oxidoreductase subunit alpha
MMQARWGSHGDYEVIALCPNSPQECFDLTVTAFNLAEQYRVPVMFMMDECVGHMTEKVVIPKAEDIEIVPRRRTKQTPAEFVAYHPCDDGVPEIADAGHGYHFHVTGLTHNEKGYPSMTPKTQDELVRRLQSKILDNADKFTYTEKHLMDDADVVVISYGITSRVALRAVQLAREQGVKAGSLRLITVWPFPDKLIAGLAEKCKGLVVPELNLGQISREVQRAAGHGTARTIGVTHAGGNVHDPKQILDAILEAAR